MAGREDIESRVAFDFLLKLKTMSGNLGPPDLPSLRV